MLRVHDRGTGAARFIGTNLSEAAVARGSSVIGLDSFQPFYRPDEKSRNVERIQSHEIFHLVKGDIRDDPLIDLLRAHGFVYAVDLTHGITSSGTGAASKHRSRNLELAKETVSVATFS